MASKFLVKKDLVEVRVGYIEEGDTIIVIRDEEEDLKKTLKDKLKYVKCKFARPNYKIFNELMENCVKNRPDGNSYIDSVLFKRQKFSHLLREMQDDDGEQVTVNKELIDNIIPELAIATVDGFDKRMDEERFTVLKKTGAIPADVLVYLEALIKGNWSQDLAVQPEQDKSKESDKNVK